MQAFLTCLEVRDFRHAPVPSKTELVADGIFITLSPLQAPPECSICDCV